MNKQQLLKPFQDLKKEIEALKKNQAIHGLMDKFQSEKKNLEKKIDKLVQEEIKKAKKFLADQKKELNLLSKKVETTLKSKPAKKVAKKTTKKAPAVKKATKKTTKKSL